MPKSDPPPPTSRRMIAVHALGRPNSSAPQTRWTRPGRIRGAEPNAPLPPPSAYPPNTPVAPSLVRGAGTDLTVTWTAPLTDMSHNDATTYVLRSSPSGASVWTTVNDVGSPYTLSGLAGNTAIDVQIMASNAAGSSPWSASGTLTTALAGPFIPNIPAAPTLAQGTGSNLTVTWGAPSVDGSHSAATTYNVRSSPAGAGTWTTLTGATSPATLTGLASSASIDVQVQAANAAGAGAWSVSSTLTTGSAGPFAPNAVTIGGVAGAPDGTTSKLSVIWSAPATDGTHGAATGYNLRSSPAGAGTWTVVNGVSSPATITGLGAASAIDVQVQATNAAGAGAWSSTMTGTTWGATVAPGGWVAASTQIHGASVAPNGGAQAFAVAAPTAVTGLSFAWSLSNTAVPTSGLIAAGTDGQTNGWGQWFNAPASAGTYYLWMLAQGAGGTTGALVTGAITVT